jgi:hypothetical protein
MDVNHASQSCPYFELSPALVAQQAPAPVDSAA